MKLLKVTSQPLCWAPVHSNMELSQPTCSFPSLPFSTTPFPSLFSPSKCNHTKCSAPYTPPSIPPSLSSRSHLVNSALLDHFMTSCHMTNHFHSLKKFLLLEDGEFAHSLATGLFQEVPSLLISSPLSPHLPSLPPSSQLVLGHSLRRLTSPAFLNPLLQSALDSSLHGDRQEAQLLSFALEHTPSLIQPHGQPVGHCTHSTTTPIPVFSLCSSPHLLF